MRLHGRFCDFEMARDLLVGVAANDALEYCELSPGQLLQCERFIPNIENDVILQRG